MPSHAVSLPLMRRRLCEHDILPVPAKPNGEADSQPIDRFRVVVYFTIAPRPSSSAMTRSTAVRSATSGAPSSCSGIVSSAFIGAS